MAKSEKFGISYLKLDRGSEHMFISVTPGFERGPGIIRDGLSSPRMRDPHSDTYVCEANDIKPFPDLPYTIDAYVQRAGTWTIYHHLKRFYDEFGEKWHIAGLQSCGDLTMNPWHVAYIRKSYMLHRPIVCGGLEGEGNTELNNRIYRCIVKWNSDAAACIKSRYAALDLVFKEGPLGESVIIQDSRKRDEIAQCLSGVRGYDSATHDISSFIHFALSGKPIVENGEEIPLESAIDKFYDIRHVFAMPEVKAHGAYHGEPVEKINFGEHKLFNDLNARRAALLSPVIIDLDIENDVKVRWDDLQAVLKDNHFKLEDKSPAKPGRYRRYSDNINKKRVEIFFPHSVYPFGVLGIHGDELVFFASGGLSGRIGSNLEGIGQMMSHFFKCDDAIVLDEGFDTFQIVNPCDSDGVPRYSNEEMLSKVGVFTVDRVKMDQADSCKNNSSYLHGNDMRKWPLNKKIMNELSKDFKSRKRCAYDDIISVEPHRSQMRSVIILAVKKNP